MSRLRGELRTAAATLLADPEDHAVGDPTASVSAAPGNRPGATSLSTLADARGHRPPKLAPRRRPTFGLAIAAALLALLVGVTARWSGPTHTGNADYQVKLAGGHLELAFSGGDTERGYAFLALAAQRTSAANSFNLTSSRPLSPRQTSLLTQTMDTTDADTRTGTRFLGQATAAARSATPLDQLGPWITSQHQLLQRLQDRLPTPALQARASVSAALLDRVSARYTAWKALAGCACLNDPKSDDLGPLPCGPCPAGATAPSSAPSPGTGLIGGNSAGSSGSAAPAPSASTAGGPAASGGTAGSGGGSGSASAGGGSGGQPGGTGAPTSAGPTPSGSGPARPSPSATKSLLPGLSLPVTVGPSGITVSLPGVGLSIGAGTSSGAGGGVNLTLPVLPPIHLP